jgi:predicted DNA-binding transcriptional regulator AlpA
MSEQHEFQSAAPHDPPQATLSLADVAKREGVTRLTVWHWVNRGIIKRGVKVQLGARLVGGRWRVTEEQLEAFHDTINDLARALVLELPPKTPNTRRLEIERACRELDRLGIKL